MLGGGKKLSKDQQTIWENGRRERKRRNYVRQRDREEGKEKQEGKDGGLSVYPDSDIYKTQAIQDLDT